MSDPSVRIINNTKYGATIQLTHAETFQVRLAVQLAGNMALVAGVPDGEDSGGRQRLRLATPDEVSERAIAMADLMTAEFVRRGWLVELPAPITIDDADKA